MWGNLLARRFPYTPSKKSRTKNFQKELPTHEQTVGASHTLAFAPANGQAPPRPCPLRELFGIKTNGNSKTSRQPVILSEVEVFSSEERGKTEER